MPDVLKEDLYGLPLEDFTPARDALARELKAAGRKDEAAEVKSLRKPSVAAWALNRAARDHPEAITRLRSAGADLRAAQEEALAGDAGRLRDAGRAVAEEVDRVATLAAGALRSAGRPTSSAQQDKIVATLRTAAVDVGAGDALGRGVLVEELEAPGFDLLGAGCDDLSGPRPPSAGRAGPRPGTAATETVEAARRELRRCQAEAESAGTRARRRAERAEVAAKRAAEAQRDADEARAEAEEAAGEAEAARRRAAEAAAALAAAEAAAAEAAAALAAAEAAAAEAALNP